MFTNSNTTLTMNMTAMLTPQTQERIIQMESNAASIPTINDDINDTSFIEKISYATVLDSCKELISTVQNNQSQMKSVLSSINDWTLQLRKHKNVEVQIQPTYLPLLQNDLSQKLPYASVTTPAHYSQQNKRKKSRIEFHSSSTTSN